MADIVKGEQNWKDKINNYMDANDKDITTLKADQNLTWINLPLESGITGNLSVAAAYNGSIIYIKGQINTAGDFRNMLISKCTGTPLINLRWADLPVAADSGIQNLQIMGKGDLHYTGSATKQINANGLFAK
jgi:hypothetical protein